MTGIGRCLLCGGEDISVTYDGPMRAGGVESDREDGFRVIHCSQCGVECLHPFPSQSGTDYADGSYWKKKIGESSMDVQKIKEKARPEQSLWIDKIGVESFRGKVVVDFGCGSGAFLDQIKDISLMTVGIEQDPTLAAAATNSGHQVYHTLEGAIKEGCKADVLVSFDVLEHIAAPAEIISSMKKVIQADGQVHIGVPNQKDFMKSLTRNYLSHYYHLAHLWYFSSESMAWLLNSAGFRITGTQYVHKYNFMNMIEWVRMGKAPGNPDSDLVDRDLDLRVSGWLEDRGGASHILVSAAYPA